MPILVISAGCEDKYVFPNEAPGQLLISYNECYAIAGSGSGIALSGQASDADGDPLYFQWSATAGTFYPPDGKGQAVAWIPPQSPAIVTITLIVTDEIAESRTSITIEAGKEFLYPLSGIAADSGFVYILDALLPFEVPQGNTLSLLEGVRLVVLGAGFDIKGTMILYEGVDIAFLSGNLTVEGKLDIRGAEGNEVLIGAGSCGSVQGEWGGIRLSGADAEGDFSHLRVYSASNGIKVEGEGATLEINNCTVTYNSGNGIEVVDGAYSTMRDCVIGYNDIGLYVRNGYADVVHSDIGYNDDTGIMLSATTVSYTINIDSCSVSNNDTYGFYLTRYARPEIHYCSIFSNGATEIGAALHLEIYGGIYPIMATNNFWGLGKDTEQEISALIHDANDDSGIQAEVVFDPWEDEPIGGVSPETR